MHASVCAGGHGGMGGWVCLGWVGGCAWDGWVGVYVSLIICQKRKENSPPPK